jgi:hypothetical protein
MNRKTNLVMRLSRKIIVLMFGIVLLSVSLGFGENAPQTGKPQPQITKMEPTEVARGGAITFTGSNFPNAEDISVFLNGKDAGIAWDVNDTKTVFTFVTPDKLALGNYNVSVRFNVGDKENKKPPLPVAPKDPHDAMLTIYSESGKVPVKIAGVRPLLSYPEKSIYGFDVLGEGFSTRGSDNGLVINKREMQVCWSDDNSCNYNDPAFVHGKIVSDRQLIFENVSRRQLGVGSTLGTALIQMRVGRTYSNSEQITLSPVARTTPILGALLIFAVVFALVIYLAKRGFGTPHIAGRRYGVFRALLLDRETHSYSLSRFQFFLWTAAAIVSYLYLMLSRSLVQGKLDFIDIPSGLPAIILISASTSILSQAVINEKGPKGAGPVQPSFADLITVGGLVVVERFQFFVWTIIGVLSFLFLVVLQDPANIKDLPNVPAGFLELMGISSLGYLGGKLTRKPGPVIEDILAAPHNGGIEFTVCGRNLSQSARFRIGDDEIDPSNIMNPDKKPEIHVPDSQSKEQNMGTCLLLTIGKVKPEWLKNGAELTIINPDGQRAAWPYKVGPIIDEINPQSIKSNEPQTLKVLGKNFEPQSVASIEGGAPPPVVSSLTLKSGNEVQLTVTMSSENKPYVATLVITNPGGRTARKEFDVDSNG